MVRCRDSHQWKPSEVMELTSTQTVVKFTQAGEGIEIHLE
jgi:hypothetical protein